jgi:hypothetical protein
MAANSRVCVYRIGPSGLATASKYSCGSTPGASQASKTRPSAGSKTPPGLPMISDPQNLGTYWHSQPHREARCRIHPHGQWLGKKRPLGASALVRGCSRWWWQVLGSNQRRLSRRFTDRSLSACPPAHPRRLRTAGLAQHPGFAPLGELGAVVDIYRAKVRHNDRPGVSTDPARYPETTGTNREQRAKRRAA